MTRDVAPYALVVGSPAKQIGWMCRCGARLHPSDDFTQCESCAQNYVFEGGTLSPTESSPVSQAEMQAVEAVLRASSASAGTPL